MSRLLKNPNTGQLMGFLRKAKKLLNGVGVGETLLLPAIVEGSELLLLLERRSERFFDLIVVATDPEMGLRHHPVNAAFGPARSGSGAIHFRTCLAINEVEKKLALDDVFWSALFNLTMRSITKDSTGDMARFYDILLPFLTGKPLEQSLIETELLADLVPIGEDPALVAKILEASEAAEDDGDDDAAKDGNSNAGGKAGDKAAGEAAASAAKEEEEEREKEKEEEEKEASAAAVVAGGIAAGASVAHSNQHGAGEGKKEGKKGPWRLPQRSSTAYVRCIFEAVNFLLVQGVGKDKALPQRW